MHKDDANNIDTIEWTDDKKAIPPESKSKGEEFNEADATGYIDISNEDDYLSNYDSENNKD